MPPPRAAAAARSLVAKRASPKPHWFRNSLSRRETLGYFGGMRCALYTSTSSAPSRHCAADERRAVDGGQFERNRDEIFTAALDELEREKALVVFETCIGRTRQRSI